MAEPSGPSAGSAVGGDRRWPRRLTVIAIALVGLAALAGATRAEPVAPPAHLVEQRPLNIAHAGAQGHAPENTLPAFTRAVELGADALEMDLQLSADDEVMVIHDGTVDRTTDGAGQVRDLTLSELRQLDAGYAWTDDNGDTPFRHQGVRIPTLGEVFEAVPEQFLMLELKSDAGTDIAPATAEVIEAHGRGDDVLVASENQAILERFRELAPTVATSMAEDEIRTFYTLHLAGLHRWWRPPGVAFQVPERHEGRHVVDDRFVSAASDLGLQVHVWTVNQRADMRRLLELGVDGVITDYPGRLAEQLERLDEPRRARRRAGRIGSLLACPAAHDVVGAPRHDPGSCGGGRR